MSTEWEVFEPSDVYQTESGVEKCIEVLYVRKVQDSVEWWAVVSDGDAFEVRYDEGYVSFSVGDWLRNIQNMSVSVRGGLSVSVDGEVGVEFDVEDAMLVSSFESIDSAADLVERRIEQ